MRREALIWLQGWGTPLLPFAYLMEYKMLENALQNLNTPLGFILIRNFSFALDFCFHNGILPISPIPTPNLFLDCVCPTLLCPVKPQKLTEVVFMYGLQVKPVGTGLRCKLHYSPDGQHNQFLAILPHFNLKLILPIPSHCFNRSNKHCPFEFKQWRCWLSPPPFLVCWVSTVN